ncbi:MAG: hypothetical protein R6W72_02640 [Desulfurivibrionaceae bacterium]
MVKKAAPAGSMDAADFLVNRCLTTAANLTEYAQRDWQCQGCYGIFQGFRGKYGYEDRFNDPQSPCQAWRSGAESEAFLPEE